VVDDCRITSSNVDAETELAQAILDDMRRRWQAVIDHGNATGCELRGCDCRLCANIAEYERLTGEKFDG
jgi:hypothetical protein